jgi:hypothetical protein
MRTTGIVVNYYREAQKAAIEPGVIPHFNETCTRYFEVSIQRRMHADESYKAFDYFSIVSWKLSEKTGVTPGQLKRSIETDEESPDYYWVRLKGMPMRGNVWAQGDGSHPGLIQTAKKVLAVADIDPSIIDLETDAVFCQNFAATPEVFDQFMRGCMNPVMDAMERPELEPLLMKPGNYSSSGVGPEQLTAIFGVPHYTMHPFIIERLFPSYAASRGWRGKMV